MGKECVSCLVIFLYIYLSQVHCKVDNDVSDWQFFFDRLIIYAFSFYLSCVQAIFFINSSPSEYIHYVLLSGLILCFVFCRFDYPQPTFQKLMKENCMEPFFVFQVLFYLIMHVS